MNRRSIIAISAFATFSLATLSFSTSAFAADPTSAGTWDLNLAKSKSTDPMPKSITRTYEVAGDLEKMTGAIVTADGKTVPIGFNATVDGKESPIQTPGGDAIVLTRADALTVTYILKLAGKQVSTGSRSLSADGKTMTFMQKGLNPAGAAFEATMVYDKH